MFPNLWIFDTYSIMILIGVISAFILVFLYFRKRKIRKGLLYSILILACVAVIAGIGSAMLFQLIFDKLKQDSTNGPFAMTFYGGLIGGAFVFILGFFLVVKKKEKDAKFMDILIIAPSAITSAHAFGRIGCFLAGCCYGVETDSIIGMTFPGMSHAVYPTQLFEAAFLFILSIILFLLAYKKDFIYTMPIYLLSYGVWRFLIEFIRGDDRGAFLFNLSPSQWISILAFLIGCVLLVIFILKNKNSEKEDS